MTSIQAAQGCLDPRPRQGRRSRPARPLHRHEVQWPPLMSIGTLGFGAIQMIVANLLSVAGITPLPFEPPEQYRRCGFPRYALPDQPACTSGEASACMTLQRPAAFACSSGPTLAMASRVTGAKNIAMSGSVSSIGHATRRRVRSRSNAVRQAMMRARPTMPPGTMRRRSHAA